MPVLAHTRWLSQLIRAIPNGFQRTYDAGAQQEVQVMKIVFFRRIVSALPNGRLAKLSLAAAALLTVFLAGRILEVDPPAPP
jgi:hypothetical protein